MNICKSNVVNITPMSEQCWKKLYEVSIGAFHSLGIRLYVRTTCGAKNSKQLRNYNMRFLLSKNKLLPVLLYEVVYQE